MTASLLLFVHAGATLYMSGLIWFVQVVHYPLLGRVGPAAFVPYELEHMSRTTWVVGPPMLIEAATTALLLLYRPEPVRPWMAWAGAALLATVWLSTAALQVPQHNALARGFEATAHATLVGTNWIRTVAWSARGVLALAMIWTLTQR